MLAGEGGRSQLKGAGLRNFGCVNLAARAAVSPLNTLPLQGPKTYCNQSLSVCIQGWTSLETEVKRARALENKKNAGLFFLRIKTRE